MEMYMDRFGVNKFLAQIFGVVICLLTLISCEKAEIPISDLLLDEEKWLLELTSAKYRGRKTGTQECKAVHDYLFSELSKMGYYPLSQNFLYRDSIFMRNIIIEIPGKSDSVTILGAHYDGAVYSSNYQAANDNASGVVALLWLAKNISKSQNTILLCFWDGEEFTNYSAFNGSDYFIKNYDRLTYVKWYCNFDCCGRVEDKIYLYYTHSLQSQIEKTLDNCENTSQIDIITKIQNNQGSDYVSFKKVGVPFWGWNDYDVFRYIHKPSDSVSEISLSKIKTVVSITLSIINQI